MNQIKFEIYGSVIRSHNAAIVLANEDPRESLIETAIQTISTSIELTVGGVKMHLAAWMDPDHWQDDWEQAGVEDVDALVAEAISTQ